MNPDLALIDCLSIHPADQGKKLINEANFNKLVYFES